MFQPQQLYPPGYPIAGSSGAVLQPQPTGPSMRSVALQTVESNSSPESPSIYTSADDATKDSLISRFNTEADAKHPAPNIGPAISKTVSEYSFNPTSQPKLMNMFMSNHFGFDRIQPLGYTCNGSSVRKSASFHSSDQLIPEASSSSVRSRVLRK